MLTRKVSLLHEENESFIEGHKIRSNQIKGHYTWVGEILYPKNTRFSKNVFSAIPYRIPTERFLRGRGGTW